MFASVMEFCYFCLISCGKAYFLPADHLYDN